VVLAVNSSIVGREEEKREDTATKAYHEDAAEPKRSVNPRTEQKARGGLKNYNFDEFGQNGNWNYEGDEFGVEDRTDSGVA